MAGSAGSIILYGLLFVVAGAMLWRYLCKVMIIPWPWWLAWWLRNPYMQLLANPNDFIHRLDLQPNHTVLEIGCGDGRILLPLQARLGDAGRVVGIDYQQGMIDRFRARARDTCFDGQLLQGDFLNSEITGPFDRILLVTVLGEIPDQKALLQKIYRLLAPGGRLEIMEVLPDPCFIRRKVADNLCQNEGLMPGPAWQTPIAWHQSWSRVGD